MSVTTFKDDAKINGGAALRSALDASGFVGFWETDLKTKTVVLTDRFADLLGIQAQCAREGVAVAAFLNGVHPDDRERVAHLIQVAHSTAGRFEAEFRTLGSSGATHWVSARGQVEKDASGVGARCRGVAVDVTDTRQSSVLTDEQAIETVSRIVDAMIVARSKMQSLGMPVLKTLMDVMLLELSRELSSRANSSRSGRLH